LPRTKTQRAIAARAGVPDPPGRHLLVLARDLRIAIITWIERTYHRRRRQTTLGRLTPTEFEIIMTQAADQAA
jgi:putative transposase